MSLAHNGRRCPVGANCTIIGTTLEQLPLRPGYWRWRRDVRDVQRCPGSTNSTGCVGSVDGGGTSPFGDDYCKRRLVGPYCRQCDPDLADPHFYDSGAYECKPCADRVIGLMQFVSWGVVSFLLVVLLLNSCFRCVHAAASSQHPIQLSRAYPLHSREPRELRAKRFPRRFARRFEFSRGFGWLRVLIRRWLKLKGRARALYLVAGTGNQFRELVSFTQVVTNVQDIYAVPFPSLFLGFTNLLAGLISFSLPLPPLECFGIVRHRRRLAAFAVAPILVCLLVILLQETGRAIGRLRGWLHRRHKRRGRGKDGGGDAENGGAEPRPPARGLHLALAAASPPPSQKHLLVPAAAKSAGAGGGLAGSVDADGASKDAGWKQRVKSVLVFFQRQLVTVLDVVWQRVLRALPWCVLIYDPRIGH